MNLVKKKNYNPNLLYYLEGLAITKKIRHYLKPEILKKQPASLMPVSKNSDSELKNLVSNFKNYLKRK